MSGIGIQSFAAVFVVLGLVVALAWLVRRGTLGSAWKRSPRAIAVETAAPLGERRSLVIVAVEGRRLLLGLTPTQISLVAELAPAAPSAPASPLAPPVSFERHLDGATQ